METPLSSDLQNLRETLPIELGVQTVKLKLKEQI